MLIQTIKKLAQDNFQSVIETRRHLHSYPELSFHEYNTADFIEKTLVGMSIPFTRMANTGIVGIIAGERPSTQVIALRADIDALPIEEKNNLPYASKTQGIMHACGHDAHTASLLGVANILQALRKDFAGTVKLIFQPAEEKCPGGASLMINEGVLQNPVPHSIIGQHVFPSLPTGKIAIRSGKHMASMDEIYIRIIGRGGHGAQPHQNIDPVVIATYIVQALQQIVSRIANPSTPSVLSIGKFIANGSVNVIADEVYMEGTFRTMDEEWRSAALVQIKQMTESIAAAMGAKSEVIIIKGYPCLINETALTEKVKSYAEEFLGKENVIDAELWMAAEDFAYYGRHIDACFYLLGVENKQKNIESALHTASFDIDENALLPGIGLMTYVALRQLGNN